MPLWPATAQSALGEALTHHQQEFLADNAGEFAHVARRVLSMLAAGGANGIEPRDALRTLPTAVDLGDWVDRLHAASIRSDPTGFFKTLDESRRMGWCNDALANDVIPAVARQLGVSWENDLISFADVTIGCARLQSSLRRMPDDDPHLSTRGHRECLVLVPKGAHHTLGAVVLARQLRRAGQGATLELEADFAALSALAKNRKFDVVMLSASRCECPDALRRLVRECRLHWAASKVILGGSIRDLGADITRTIEADNLTNEWREAI